MQEAGGLIACLANGRVHVYNLESLARFGQTCLKLVQFFDVLAVVGGILLFSSQARKWSKTIWVFTSSTSPLPLFSWWQGQGFMFLHRITLILWEKKNLMLRKEPAVQLYITVRQIFLSESSTVFQSLVRVSQPFLAVKAWSTFHVRVVF